MMTKPSDTRTGSSTCRPTSNTKSLRPYNSSTKRYAPRQPIHKVDYTIMRPNTFTTFFKQSLGTGGAAQKLLKLAKKVSAEWADGTEMLGDYMKDLEFKSVMRSLLAKLL